jgi:hypothetical protein
MAKGAQTLDFTNVKEGGGRFNKKRQEQGDYKAKILKVENVSKKGDKSRKMWLFSIKAGTGVYPLYCGFNENELWKIRQLWAAVGKNVPKKRVMVDPNTIVGLELAVTLEDDEYDNKQQSTIASTFPLSDLDSDIDDTDEEGTDEEDVEDEEPAPKAKKKKKKKAKAADDEDLEELDIDDV